MSKVYVLYHIHKFSKELSECFCGHVDIKQIGIFDSKEICQNILEEYKKLEGFRENPNGFQIDGYKIDSIYNTPINELIDQYELKQSNAALLYLLYFVQEFDDGHEDVKLLGVFSSEENAEKALAIIKDIPEIKHIKNQFEIHEDKIGRLAWTEGFFVYRP